MVYQAELDTRISATLVLILRDHLLPLLPLEKEAVRKARLLPWSGPLLFNGQFDSIMKENEQMLKQSLAAEQLTVARAQVARSALPRTASKQASGKKSQSKKARYKGRRPFRDNPKPSNGRGKSQ